MTDERTLAELRALLARNPRLASKTGAMLAGELPCPDLERTMSDEQGPTLHMRVTQEIFNRTDALIPEMQKDATWRAAPTLSRSTVLRLALLEGLAALELKYRAPKRKR